MKTISTYLGSKVLKLQTTSLTLLTHLLKVFGPRKFVPIKFKDQIEVLMSHPKPAVKSEAALFYTALYLWIGEETTLVFAENLKTSIRDQLKKDFKASSDERNDTLQNRAKPDEISATEKALLRENVVMENEILAKYNPDWIALLK